MTARRPYTAREIEGDMLPCPACRVAIYLHGMGDWEGCLTSLAIKERRRKRLRLIRLGKPRSGGTAKGGK